MKHLSKHIDELETLMNRKGFDGHFLTNFGCPGKLRESLNRHLQEVLQCETHVRPFFLTTYSLWNDESSPYVKCDFKVRYDPDDGFKVMKLDAQYVMDHEFNRARTLEIRPLNNEDVPTREKLSASVGPRKKRGLSH